MTEHTKTPWYTACNEANWVSAIIDEENDFTICQCEGLMERAEANASFIVKAVNAYGPMLEALNKIEMYMGHSHDSWATQVNTVRKIADDAVHKADKA